MSKRTSPTAPKLTATQRRQRALDEQAHALGFSTWRRAETAILRGTVRLTRIPDLRDADFLAQRNRHRTNSREGDRKTP